MTTIYAVYDRNGCVGRCDAKCHEAKEPDCDCICGGAFHGVGSKVACEDWDTLTDEEILDNCRDLVTKGTLRIQRRQKQLALFE